MVDSIADRLSLWMAGMMTKVGRLAMDKLELMAIPLHQVILPGLNKKTLKQIERIVRSFLWGRKVEC
jgi:hypothetical protein